MKMLKKMKNKKGFTLIELIVVIAVIAILAAILLPRFTGFSESAKEKAVLSDARNYAVAVQALIAEKSDVFNGLTTDTVDETAVKTFLGTVSFPGTLSITATNGSFTYTSGIYTATYVGGTGVGAGEITVSP